MRKFTQLQQDMSMGHSPVEITVGHLQSESQPLDYVTQRE
jgi:hypothetical protein